MFQEAEEVLVAEAVDGEVSVMSMEEVVAVAAVVLEEDVEVAVVVAAVVMAEDVEVTVEEINTSTRNKRENVIVKVMIICNNN